jgi:hypothetical protein
MSVTRYERAVDLLEADIGNELVALEPAAGNCFGFNEVATVVWRSLAEPKSFDELRDGLIADYDVSSEQCSAELKALLDEMKAQGLVRQA